MDIEQTTKPSKKIDGSNTRRGPYLSINQPTTGDVMTMHHPNRAIATPIEVKLQPNSLCKSGANELKLNITATAQPMAVPTTQAITTYHP